MRSFEGILRSTGSTFLFLIGVCLTAQNWSVYDLDNSPITSTTVNALAVDRLGGVWVGTDWGLCHFDGDATWEVYQSATSDLPDNHIRALALDTADHVWVGMQTNGVSYWDGSTWTNFNTSNSPIAENEVRGLFVDHRNWVWICTSSGLSVYTGTEWFRYDATDESHNGQILATSSTNCVAVRPDGLICLGTVNGGLHFLDDTDLFYLNIPEHGFFDNTATDVLFDPVSGDRWVSTPSAGLLRQQGPAFGGSWYQWALISGFPADGISAITMDGEGHVWSATHAGGVIELMPNGGTYEQYTTVNSALPDNETRSIEAGPNGEIWVGTTYGGLARFQPSVGVLDLDTDLRIRVFPNPTSRLASVRLDHGNGPFEWYLYGAGGMELERGSGAGNGMELTLVGRASGVYVLKLITAEGIAVQRILLR